MARPSTRSDAQAAFATLSADDQGALRRYRDQNGRTWKSALRCLWAVAALDRHPDGAALKRVRNVIGPSGLDRVTL